MSEPVLSLVRLTQYLYDYWTVILGVAPGSCMSEWTSKIAVRYQHPAEVEERVHRSHLPPGPVFPAAGSTRWTVPYKISVGPDRQFSKVSSKEELQSRFLGSAPRDRGLEDT